MTAVKRLLAAGFVCLLVFAGGAGTPAAAYQSGPAVEIPAEENAAEEQPWTTRFLVPTALTVTALVIAGAGAYYVVRIRGRYHVTS